MDMRVGIQENDKDALRIWTQEARPASSARFSARLPARFLAQRPST